MLQEQIGLRIRELRQECGLTQQELALRTATNRSSVNLIENGRMNLSVQTLERIMTALSIDTASFFASELFAEHPAVSTASGRGEKQHE